MTKGMAANGGQGLSGFAWTMLFLNNILCKTPLDIKSCIIIWQIKNYIWKKRHHCSEFSKKKERKQLFQFALGTLSPPQRATGACRPRGGRQAHVARWGGDRSPPFFFSRSPGPGWELTANRRHLSYRTLTICTFMGCVGIFELCGTSLNSYSKRRGN